MSGSRQRVWLVQLGEPLPIEQGSRLFRCGALAETLAAAGHDVTWWTSSFNHQLKTVRSDRSLTLRLRSNYRIELLDAPGYRRNVSLARLRFHAAITREFKRVALQSAAPSVIVAGFPLPSLAAAAMDIGRSARVPVLVDVRDQWPDAFVDLVPSIYRRLARPLLLGFHERNRRIFSRASGIVASSRTYLNWALRYADRALSADDRVVPLGYPSLDRDAADVRAARRRWKDWGIDENCFVCCFFGTVGRHFDLGTVIRAAARLERAHGKKFTFVICGLGDHLRKYKALASGLSSVLFPGWVGAAEIGALMDIAKVGLAPYSATARMSLPNKAFEYFAGGLPVISSLDGELAALLSDESVGFTYRAGDTDGFTSILTWLAHNENERRRLAANAAALHRRRFAADVVSRDYAEHIERVAGASRR